MPDCLAAAGGPQARSELVEGDDVDGLNLFIELHDLLLDKISGDLIILDSGANDDLEDTVGNGFLLPLGLPEKTVHGDADDLVSEHLQVGLLAPWLHFPNDERLGNGSSLFLLLLSLLILFLEGLGGSGSLLRVLLSEWVEVVVVGGGSSSGRLSLLLLLLGLLATLLLLASLLALLVALDKS